MQDSIYQNSKMIINVTETFNMKEISQLYESKLFNK